MKSIKHLSRAIIVPIVLLLFAFSLSAGDWKLSKDTNGIKVYIRDIPGSSFKEYKAVTELKTSLPCVMKLMEDIEAHPQWLPNLIEIKILKKISPKENIVYELIDAPFPTNDRDCIFKTTAAYDPKMNIATLTIESLPDYMPEKQGIVRLKKASGSWIFKPDKEKGTVTVIYQMHSEPGGNLPAWLANTAVVKRPYTTLLNMKSMVQKQKYMNATEEELKKY